MPKDSNNTVVADSSNAPNSIFPTYKGIEKILSKYSLGSFNDPQTVEQYLGEFALQKLCSELEADRTNSISGDLERSVTAFEEKPYEPEYSDLCRLHYLALSRKSINILEFGSGFSTAIMADALRLLSEYFGVWVKENIRVQNPFHIYAIEEEQRFLEITQKRLGSKLANFATLSRSSVEFITFDNRFATVYSKIPNISPDFIYLDGPSQFGTTAEISGFSFNSPVRMPMSADILRFEFFLEPGTLILIDGRTQNARFLKSYLKRNWAYYHDPVGDAHYFELQENPLGPYNKKKMDFCLSERWLIR